MASWRRRAIEQFPTLRDELNGKQYTIYQLFADLLVEVREAHRANDSARLSTVYDFAEWCARQRAKPLWNAAGVSFYEHLFREPWMRDAAAAWLPADIRSDCLGLWELSLAPADFAQVKRILAATPPRAH